MDGGIMGLGVVQHWKEAIGAILSCVANVGSTGVTYNLRLSRFSLFGYKLGGGRNSAA